MTPPYCHSYPPNRREQRCTRAILENVIHESNSRFALHFSDERNLTFKSDALLPDRTHGYAYEVKLITGGRNIYVQ